MAVKKEQKLPRREQNKSEDTSKQKAEARREQRNSIPPLEQKSTTPKQDALNEALGDTARNLATNATMDAVGGDNPALGTLMQQYADRADRQYSGWDGYNLPKNFINSDDGFPDYKNLRSERGNIAPGSIDPDVDTVYRVGADDPYGYYSQSQLNNAMSGPDANAIYAATHNQQDIADYNDPYWQEYLGDLMRLGLKPNTAQQRPNIPINADGAYVTGADAFAGRNGHVLRPGQGSSLGIPTWMLR
jgi:hypothetical protein